MPISSLFSGMEAYLDDGTSYTDTVDDTAIADQTAEVASDTADATEEAKDTEVASQMLSRMCDMYDHVKQFGIDRTFVSLYNRHGELDRVCGIQFPSCESMDVVGDRYSMYSTAFIAAMESSGGGLWAKVKEIVSKIWNWIKNVASKIWEKIKSLFGFKKKRWQKIVDFLKRNKGKIAIGAGVTAAIAATTFYIKKNHNSKKLQQISKKAEKTVKTIEKAVDASVDSRNSPETVEQVINDAAESATELRNEVQNDVAETKKNHTSLLNILNEEFDWDHAADQEKAKRANSVMTNATILLDRTRIRDSRHYTDMVMCLNDFLQSRDKLLTEWDARHVANQIHQLLLAANKLEKRWAPLRMAPSANYIDNTTNPFSANLSKLHKAILTASATLQQMYNLLIKTDYSLDKLDDNLLKRIESLFNSRNITMLKAVKNRADSEFNKYSDSSKDEYDNFRSEVLRNLGNPDDDYNRIKRTGSI